MDGHPLILVDGTHFTPSAEYRTEIDNFSKIKAYEKNGRLYFRVSRKDGRILTYGGSLNAELHRIREERLVRSWALARIEDRIGNYIGFHYGKFVDDSRMPEDQGQDQTVEFWPDEISYGGVVNQSEQIVVQPSRSIRFVYVDNRNDFMEGYTRGRSRILRTKLLSRIITNVRDRAVRSYDLTYENAPTGVPGLDPASFGISRLKQIRECSFRNSQRDCKRPTVFTYSDQHGLVDVDNEGTYYVLTPGSFTNSAIHALDWNGDLRGDLLVGSAGGVPAKLLIATGDRRNPYRVKETNIQCPEVFDVNHDGRDDVLDTCWGDIYESTGNENGEAFVISSADGGPQETRLYLPDLNGDGTKDLFVCSGGGVWHRLGIPGEGFTIETEGPRIDAWGSCDGLGNRTPVDFSQAGILVNDFDGDGTDDLMMSGVGGFGPAWWARYDVGPDNVGRWVPLENLGEDLHTASYHGGVRFIDVNGDGLKDLLGSTDRPLFYMNLGGEFNVGRSAYGGMSGANAPAASIDRSIAVDFTGDGRGDLLRVGSASWLLDVGMQRDPNAQIRGGMPWLRPDPAASGGGPGYFFPQPGILPRLGYMSTSGRRPSQSRADTATLLDVDGDGSNDIAMLVEGGIAVAYTNMDREHLLTRVIDGMGKRINVAYNANQGAVRTYTPGIDCLSPDDRSHSYSICAKSVGPLVSSHIVSYDRSPSDGSVLDRDFKYRYEDGRMGLFGRGWLGFQKRVVEEFSPDDQLISRTEVSEDNGSFNLVSKLYPFAGLEQTKLVISEVASSPISSGQSRKETHRVNFWTEKVSSKGRPFPFIDETVERVAEYTGARDTVHPISTTRHILTGDPYGNVTHRQTEVLGPTGELVSSSTVNAPFEIRVEPWLINLLDSVTVTNVVPNEGTTIRSVNYEYNTRGLVSVMVRQPEADVGDPQGLRQVTEYTRDPQDPFQALRSVMSVGRWKDSTGQVVNGVRKTSLTYDRDTIFAEHVSEHRTANVVCTPENFHTEDCLTTDVRYHPFDGTILTRVDPTGLIERFSHDAFGRIRSHRTPGDTVTTTYEDAVPNTTEAIDVFPKIKVTTRSTKTSAETIRYFDSLERVVQSVSRGLEGQAFSEEREYLFGDLVSRTSRPHLVNDPSQDIVHRLYDTRFRLSMVSFPNDAQGRPRRVNYAYASVGFATVAMDGGETAVTRITDANGHSNLSYSDPRGLNVRNVDANQKSTRYAYGPFGKLSRVREGIDGAADHVINYQWDALGRATLRSDDDSGTTTFGYTAFDQPAFERDNANRITGFHYDHFGRLVSTNAPEGLTEFAYDGPGDNSLGRLVATRSPTSSGGSIVEEYNYEAVPANADQNRAFLESIERTIEGETFTTSLHYDTKNQLARVTMPATPDGDANRQFEVHYAYDTFGNLSCVADRAVATPADCTGSYFWKFEQGYQGHRLQRESFGNGVTTTYDYEDTTGNIQSISTMRGSATVQLIEYTNYDLVGNLTFRRQTFGNVGGSGTTTFEQRFSYDPLDRLDVVINRNPAQGGAESLAQDLDYDSSGNIKRKLDVGTYDYARRIGDPTRNPHAVRSISRGAQVVANFHYDAVGNMIHRSGEGVEGGSQTMTYTSFNLPQTVTAGSKNIRYEYDMAHRRVMLSVDTDGNPNELSLGDQKRIYIGGEYERVHGEDEGGEYTKHLYKVQAVGRQVAQVEREEREGVLLDDVRRYIHSDHLRSSQVFTDKDGAVVHVQRFDAFGAPINPASNSADDEARNIRAGFTGHETDAETGLINMKGRIYDPRIGRFLQADRVVRHGSSQGLNRYSYVFNNPLNLWDPSGLDPDETDPGKDPGAGKDPGPAKDPGDGPEGTTETRSDDSKTIEVNMPPIKGSGAEKTSETATGDTGGGEPTNPAPAPTNPAPAPTTPAPAPTSPPSGEGGGGGGGGEGGGTGQYDETASQDEMSPTEHWQSAGDDETPYEDTFAFWISHADFWGSSFIQSDQKLENAQNTALLISGAALVAAGGGGLLALGGTGLTGGTLTATGTAYTVAGNMAIGALTNVMTNSVSTLLSSGGATMMNQQQFVQSAGFGAVVGGISGLLQVAQMVSAAGVSTTPLSVIVVGQNGINAAVGAMGIGQNPAADGVGAIEGGVVDANMPAGSGLGTAVGLGVTVTIDAAFGFFGGK